MGSRSGARQDRFDSNSSANTSKKPRPRTSQAGHPGPPSYQQAIKQNDRFDARYLAEGSTHSVHGPPCSHWADCNCEATGNFRKCCSCMDTRSVTKSGLYTAYVDGEGYVEKATRWQYYCPSCKEYFDPDAKAKVLRDQKLWAEKRARSLAEERDRAFFGLGRYFLR
ncbi:uncharacterized protein F4822DRAFT_425908 [Hypoxylon trugodes]|uniref:uncharacterized protein n=1 Tax=Hypoxylon trugodes TaxID=326681 RepID=UPI0021925DDB|nr:uncharacterized protein F4822DRAFT_425908 [Hypoxylon trugodes]KAI1392704.1 hypothetical protein F4822DRAFT_425908 [Hypoxylon trugodes]